MAAIQLDILTAIEARNQGIQQAIMHADAVEENWSERAYQFLIRYLSAKPRGFRFMIEEVRAEAQRLGALSEPPSNRAFGGVAVRARNNGLIRSCGLKAVKNVRAHSCFATEWEKI